MDVTATLEVNVPAPQLRQWVDDLCVYPLWLTIVPFAELVTGEEATWIIELRAKVGLLSRSKKLRMARTINEPNHLRFERAEIDGRNHSPWILDVALTEDGDRSRLVMGLHYGGSFGGGVVERLLADEIESSKERLRSMVEFGTDTP